MRVGFGALTLGLFPAARRVRIDRVDLPRIVLLGVLWMAIPLSIFPFAEARVSSSVTGMLNGATPLFIAVVAAFMARRLPPKQQMVGVAVGFSGVVLIAVASGSGGDNSWFGIGLIFVALVFYGVSLNLAVPLQQKYGGLPVLWRAQMIAFVLVTPFAIPSLSEVRFAWGPFLAVVALGVFGTALAFVVMASNAEANLFHMNSLEFPAGHLTGVEPAAKAAQLGTMDVLMTNPPFGSDIPITDPNILKHFELAHNWERTEDGAFRNTGRLQGSVAPEVLFIERCVDWLRPGGRMGIVLPDGILGNPGDEYIRWWILRHCWVLASIDLPVEVFIVEANVNILTSLLFLKKKTPSEVQAEDLGAKQDYPVFMAVAEKVGFDRRGNTLYMRSPDGEEILEETEEVERIRVGGEVVSRSFKRKKKIVDDDLPRIAEAFREFRKKHKEPGA